MILAPGRLTRTSKLWTKGAYLSGVRTCGGDCLVVFCCFAFSSEFGCMDRGNRFDG